MIVTVIPTPTATAGHQSDQLKLATIASERSEGFVPAAGAIVAIEPRVIAAARCVVGCVLRPPDSGHQGVTLGNVQVNAVHAPCGDGVEVEISHGRLRTAQGLRSGRT